MEKDFLAEEMENLDNSFALQPTFTICYHLWDFGKCKKPNIS